mmetsp:Transcript_102006/g.243215  ORF Transcript_102006/g.243215 Transcript_102006/m.243215 type:complete len:585 (-) Transcript_102006:572-2326(-)
MEVVGHPRHPALDASLAAVVLRHDLARRLEERTPDLGRKLCQAIDVLRALQRVSRHVVGQAEAKNRGRIEATNQTCLVLCPARLIANAASFLCPDFGVDSTDVAHGRALGVIALLGRVTGRHGNPAAALLVELGSQLCDVVLVGCLSPGEGRELGGLRCSLCKFMCQFLHSGCHTQSGIALRVDALPLPIAIHNGGSNLLLQNCQHASIWVVWDLNVCKGLVGSCFPSSELGTGEEVVQGLCISGCCSHDCWLAKPEVFSRIVAHLVPSVGCDHGLAQLRICCEGDFAGSHQLCLDVVQPRSSHAKDVPGLVGDLAVAVGIAVQPPCMEDDGAILGRRKRRCRVSFCTHHQLCKSVASVALAIGLQQCECFVFDLWTSIALDKGALVLTFFILEDEGFHGGPGVVVAHFRDVARPLPRLLVEILWHKEVNLVIAEANFHNLLQSGVEPHESAAICDGATVHLKLNLVETSITFCIHPLLKVDPVRAVHLCDHLLHGPSNLVRLVGMVQVRGPFATATMDTLDQTLFGEVHVEDFRHELFNASLLGVGISEVDQRRILLGEHREGRRRCPHLLTDSFEADLLQAL